MEDRKTRLRRIWTVERLAQAIEVVSARLGSQVRGAWQEFVPLDLIERLELRDRLESAEAMLVLESLRDLAILEIQRRYDGCLVTYWFRTGTLGVYAAHNPQQMKGVLETFLGYAEEPRCRSG